MHSSRSHASILSERSIRSERSVNNGPIPGTIVNDAAYPAWLHGAAGQTTASPWFVLLREMVHPAMASMPEPAFEEGSGIGLGPLGLTDLADSIHRLALEYVNRITSFIPEDTLTSVGTGSTRHRRVVLPLPISNLLPSPQAAELALAATAVALYHLSLESLPAELNFSMDFGHDREACRWVWSAWKQRAATPTARDPAAALLQPRDGNYSWVRTGKMPQDSLERLSAACVALRRILVKPGVEKYVASTCLLPWQITEAVPQKWGQTVLRRSQATALEAATAASAAGAHVAVIVKLSPYRLGGDLLVGGLHEQESAEELCMQSTLFPSLQKAADIAEAENMCDVVGCPVVAPEDGAVLIPGLEVIHAGVEDGYVPIGDRAVKLVAALGISIPNRDPRSWGCEVDLRSDRHYKAMLCRKFETVVRGAADIGADVLVMGFVDEARGSQEYSHDVGVALGAALQSLPGALREVILTGSDAFAQSVYAANTAPEIPLPLENQNFEADKLWGVVKTGLSPELVQRYQKILEAADRRAAALSDLREATAQINVRAHAEGRVVEAIAQEDQDLAALCEAISLAEKAGTPPGLLRHAQDFVKRVECRASMLAELRSAILAEDALSLHIAILQADNCEDPEVCQELDKAKKMLSVVEGRTAAKNRLHAAASKGNVGELAKALTVAEGVQVPEKHLEESREALKLLQYRRECLTAIDKIVKNFRRDKMGELERAIEVAEEAGVLSPRLRKAKGRLQEFKANRVFQSPTSSKRSPRLTSPRRSPRLPSPKTSPHHSPYTSPRCPSPENSQISSPRSSRPGLDASNASTASIPRLGLDHLGTPSKRSQGSLNSFRTPRDLQHSYRSPRQRAVRIAPGNTPRAGNPPGVAQALAELDSAVRKGHAIGALSAANRCASAVGMPQVFDTSHNVLSEVERRGALLVELRAAMEDGDIRRLRTAMKRADEFPEPKPEIKRANEMLRLAQENVKEQVQEAIELNTSEALRTAIRQAEDVGVAGESTEAAQKCLEKLVFQEQQAIALQDLEAATQALHLENLRIAYDRAKEYHAPKAELEKGQKALQKAEEREDALSELQEKACFLNSKNQVLALRDMINSAKDLGVQPADLQSADESLRAGEYRQRVLTLLEYAVEGMDFNELQCAISNAEVIPVPEADLQRAREAFQIANSREIARREMWMAARNRDLVALHGAIRHAQKEEVSEFEIDRARAIMVATEERQVAMANLQSATEHGGVKVASRTTEVQREVVELREALRAAEDAGVPAVDIQRAKPILRDLERTEAAHAGLQTSMHRGAVSQLRLAIDHAARVGLPQAKVDRAADVLAALSQLKSAMKHDNPGVLHAAIVRANHALVPAVHIEKACETLKAMKNRQSVLSTLRATMRKGSPEDLQEAIELAEEVSVCPREVAKAKVILQATESAIDREALKKLGIIAQKGNITALRAACRRATENAMQDAEIPQKHEGKRSPRKVEALGQIRFAMTKSDVVALGAAIKDAELVGVPAFEIARAKEALDVARQRDSALSRQRAAKLRGTHSVAGIRESINRTQRAIQPRVPVRWRTSQQEPYQAGSSANGFNDSLHTDFGSITPIRQERRSPTRDTTGYAGQSMQESASLPNISIDSELSCFDIISPRHRDFHGEAQGADEKEMLSGGDPTNDCQSLTMLTSEKRASVSSQMGYPVECWDKSHGGDPTDDGQSLTMLASEKRASVSSQMGYPVESWDTGPGSVDEQFNDGQSLTMLTSEKRASVSSQMGYPVESWDTGPGSADEQFIDNKIVDRSLT